MEKSDAGEEVGVTGGSVVWETEVLIVASEIRTLPFPVQAAVSAGAPIVATGYLKIIHVVGFGCLSWGNLGGTLTSVFGGGRSVSDPCCRRSSKLP